MRSVQTIATGGAALAAEAVSDLRVAGQHELAAEDRNEDESEDGGAGGDRHAACLHDFSSGGCSAPRFLPRNAVGKERGYPPMVPWASRHGPGRARSAGRSRPPECLPPTASTPLARSWSSSVPDRFAAAPGSSPLSRPAWSQPSSDCRLAGCHSAGDAASPVDRLPDLAMAYPTELRFRPPPAGRAGCGSRR